MNLCDGDCEHARKLQELQPLVAAVAEESPEVNFYRREDVDKWRRVLELLDIPTF